MTTPTWRPIETAPRDRMIIVGRREQIRNDLVTFAFWMSSHLVTERLGTDEGSFVIVGGRWDPTPWLNIEIPPVPDRARGQYSAGVPYFVRGANLDS
jgi:hypothetical protein